MSGCRGNRALVAALFWLVSVPACAGTPVSEEHRQLAERGLLQPFLQRRLVVCEELTVDITPNFHRHVGIPGASGPGVSFEHRQEPALDEKVWTNVTGVEAGWLTVTIGEPPDLMDPGKPVGPRTTFRVMNRFTLRVHERGQMALTAVAGGGFVAVDEAGAEARRVRRFEIVDGVLRR